MVVKFPQICFQKVLDPDYTFQLESFVPYIVYSSYLPFSILVGRSNYINSSYTGNKEHRGPNHQDPDNTDEPADRSETDCRHPHRADFLRLASERRPRQPHRQPHERHEDVQQ